MISAITITELIAMRASSLYSSNSLVGRIRQRLLDASNDAELLWGVSAFNLIVSTFLLLGGFFGLIYVRSFLREAKRRADLTRSNYQVCAGKASSTSFI